MSRKIKAIGVFAERQDVAVALQELKSFNYPLRRVLVLAKEGDSKKPIAGVKVCDRDDIPEDGDLADHHNIRDAIAGAVAGSVFGSAAGLLAGLTVMAIPGLGQTAFFGIGASVVAGSVSSSLVGFAAGGFVGALVSMGIPRHKAKIYEEEIQKGKYLLLIRGSKYDTIRAESILGRMETPATWSFYEDAATEARKETKSDKSLEGLPQL
ncbi:MAG: hypothetical protein SAJ12_16815 [Jaaginema sp. PMC 1079.18]|nr:hypothetical protein [Jaaginema sp. PMC 1080.18]MEC4852646.1 hypothetical protein [Jaaginema sp. PMC 1079.18]MEC4864615.1 hypothetical protein [Jaaginema sp. PMC 1078.18]